MKLTICDFCAKKVDLNGNATEFPKSTYYIRIEDRSGFPAVVESEVCPKCMTKLKEIIIQNRNTIVKD